VHIHKIIVLALLAGWAAAFVPSLAGQSVKDTPHKGMFADSALRTGRLANGLTYYIRENDEPGGLAEMRLVVRAGSLLEDADQRGGAHVLEHMAFNGTRRFRKDEIVGYLERLGMRFGADVNAFTGLDQTVYHLTVPTDTAGALALGLRVMEDWASSITLDPAELARERGVVAEEWRARRGATERIFEREHAFLWAGSPYADRLVIGDVEAVRRLQPAQLERFYRDWYRPDLMAVVVVGDFDAERVEKLVRLGFGGLAGPADPRPRPQPAAPLGQGHRVLVTTDPELVQAVVEVCWMRTAPRLLTRRDRMDDLATRMFGAMLDRRLEQAARQPDAPFAFAQSSYDEPLPGVGRFCLAAAPREGGTERSVAAMVAEAERVARDGFTEAEWEREAGDRMRSMMRESGYALTSASAADAYVAAFLSGNVPVLPHQQADFDFEFTEEVDRGAVQAQAQGWARAPDRVVLLNAPEHAADSEPGEARLAQVADSASSAGLAAYVDVETGGELMPRPPEPGRVVAEDTVAGLGVVRWTLSNGARVVVRARAGDSDDVRLLAVSPGGLSLVADSLFIHAGLSPLVVQFSGLGTLSTEDLERALEEYRVQVEPFVDEASEGISGVAYPGALETMFQLVHLEFTDPRLDTAAWDVAVQRVTATMRGRGADPAQVFTDTLRTLLGAADPRGVPIPNDVFERVNPALALAAFRERFANAGDFTFYLAGFVDMDELRPLVERYLASLPSTGARETAVDRGNRPPAGIVERTVRAGPETSGTIAVVFNGEERLSRDQWADVQSVAEVLEHRLRTRLRSDLGIVYDQDVSALRAETAAPAWYVGVYVPAAPGRLEEVARVVLAEVDSLRAHGGSEDDVVRVREAARREWEENRHEPGFWVSELRDADENGWDPRLIREAPPTTTLTRERVRDAARAFLRPDRYVRVTLVPAAASPAAAAPPRD
jgi:zinc protease